MRAADVKATAYLAGEIDEAIQSGARAIDRLCHRGDETRPGFAPWTGTITYDWPGLNNNSAYRFHLNQNALSSLTTAVSGGLTITTNTILRPETGPPYGMVDVDQGTSSLFTNNSGAGQRSLALTGVFCGCRVRERTLASWQLSGALSDSAETASIDAPLGVGNLIRVGTERMLVTERAWVDSGQGGSLTASRDAQSMTVATASAFLAGEEILVDAERMLVRDVAGDNIIVQRAISGSTLAAHTTAAIFWSRSFTLQRAALGTTAASHLDNAQVYVYEPPAPIEQLNIAYALDQRAQESSAYARTVGTGDAERQAGGGGIKALEDRVYFAYGRKLRHRAV